MNITDYGYGLINVQAMIDEMLKNTKVFISPTEKIRSKANVRIYNNSTDVLSAVGIAAEYDDGRFIGFRTKDISLPPGKTDILNCENNKNVKFMLWSDFESLKPLAACR